jgi:hypothetical protein
MPAQPLKGRFGMWLRIVIWRSKRHCLGKNRIRSSAKPPLKIASGYANVSDKEEWNSRYEDH